MEDISDVPVANWHVSEWGKDWYAPDRWEEGFPGFYRSVYYRRFGGDLVGLREKLDYLQELGVNAIYLNPIFMAPSLHKYDAACLHHVDPTLGPDRDGDIDLLGRAGETEDPGTWIWTAADRCFLDLIAEVHRRGMRIIIDGVFNHVGTRFFAFRDLLMNGERSRYRDWFRITRWEEDGSFEYKCWFGHKALPELARKGNTLAKPVREYIFAITRRWMDPNSDGDPSDGVDGWRLDVAFCVPGGFWRAWRKHVKRINPEAFLTAEIVELASEYLRGDQFDSVMNYMWMFPAVMFFGRKENPISAATLQRRLDVLRREYPEECHGVLQNLLDSHDVGRIATVLENGAPVTADWESYFQTFCASVHPDLVTRKPRRKTYELLKQLVIFQMTYPGAPMIYYGTESGMWGANDPDNRQPMLWDDLVYDDETHGTTGSCLRAEREFNVDMFRFYQRAIRLRQSHAALRRGVFNWVRVKSPRLLAFERKGEGERIRVYLNAGTGAAPVKLDRAGVDLWTGRKVKRGTVQVGPGRWLVLGVGATSGGGGL